MGFPCAGRALGELALVAGGGAALPGGSGSLGPFPFGLFRAGGTGTPLQWALVFTYERGSHKVSLVGTE